MKRERRKRKIMTDKIGEEWKRRERKNAAMENFSIRCKRERRKRERGERERERRKREGEIERERICKS